jgi:hypothetical protein
MNEHETTRRRGKSASQSAAALDLEPLRCEVTLPPRIARRLRALAQDRGKPVDRVAATLLAAAVVPNRQERRVLATRDLRDALGDEGAAS